MKIYDIISDIKSMYTPLSQASFVSNPFKYNNQSPLIDKLLHMSNCPPVSNQKYTYCLICKFMMHL